ncbi:ThiF family adenylyltransferase [Pseudoalteromonas sp. SIMBA_153]
MYSEQCLPIFKPTVEKTFLEDKIIISHGEDSYLLDDSLDFLKSLHATMNGQNTILQISDLVCNELPHKKHEDIIEAIEQLDQMLLLEDNYFNLNKLNYISQDVIDRWCRNFDFFGSLLPLAENKYAIQARLQEAKVCLLGLGGLGSNIILSLAAIGIKNVVAADFDRIEQSNLNRQILYKESDVGSIKSETAEKRIKDFYPQMHTDISQQKFESMEQLSEFIQGCDLVIGVADKPRMKMPIWMNEACVQNKIPFISGGLSVNRGVFYSVVPDESGCVYCWRSQANKESSLSKAVHEDKHTSHTQFETPYSWPAIIPLVSFVSGAMVTEAVKILTNIGSPSYTNKLTQICFKNVETKVVEQWEKQPNCPVCGS